MPDINQYPDILKQLRNGLPFSVKEEVDLIEASGSPCQVKRVRAHVCVLRGACHVRPHGRVQ